jgi:CubicO group peptidase (beta-lactamase class C family)
VIGRRRATASFALIAAAMASLSVTVVAVGPTPGADAAVYPGCTISAAARNGDQGDAVHCIELALSARGLQSRFIDTYFGTVTASAVRSFQRANGLSATGVVDQQTATALGIWSSDAPPGTTLPSGREAADRALLQAVQRTLGSRTPFSAVVIRDGAVVASTPRADVTQRAASLSKTVTAATVMSLIDDGAISLSTTLGEVLALPMSATASTITIRDLLAQTAGVPNERWSWFGGRYTSCPLAASTVLARRISGKGTYEYSNSNFCVLSLVIEAVTGTSYEQAVRQRVFTPLGITSASIDDSYRRLAGAGAWRLSAHDAARVMAALEPTGRHGFTLLSPISRFAMALPTSRSYALGVWVYGDGSRGHSGSVSGVRNIMVNLTTGETVAIMAQTNMFSSGLDLFPVAVRAAAAVRASQGG